MGRLGLIGEIEIDSPSENVLWVNCISGGLENCLGRQVLIPVVVLVDFFFFSLPYSLPWVSLSLVTDV